MSQPFKVMAVFAGLAACGDPETTRASAPQAGDVPRAAAQASPSGSEAQQTEILALGGANSADANAPGLVLFVDPDSGIATIDVHDADRQIVHFDSASQAMLWSASGDSVGGWSTLGVELRWERSGVAFRVRFGNEQGERRAYFTEADRGTICDLNITAPESLSIRATSQTPPE